MRRARRHSRRSGAGRRGSVEQSVRADGTPGVAGPTTAVGRQPAVPEPGRDAAPGYAVPGHSWRTQRGIGQEYLSSEQQKFQEGLPTSSPLMQWIQPLLTAGQQTAVQQPAALAIACWVRCWVLAHRP